MCFFFNIFSSKQWFEESQCSCKCLDEASKHKCYNRGGTWHWNEDECQCMCKPKEQWDECGTGMHSFLVLSNKNQPY